MPSLSVTVDREEYCKYEAGMDTVTASVAVTGLPVYGESVRISLRKARRLRDAEVWSTTLTVGSYASPAILSASIPLRDIVDGDNIPLVRHGNYFVHAELVSDPGVTAASSDFRVAVISASGFRESFLFGLPAQATEQRYLQSDLVIPGVKVLTVSSGFPLGPINLSYNYSSTVVSNASAILGSGVDGTVTVGAVGALAGALGNSVTISLVADPGTSPLSVSVIGGTHLQVNLAVTAGSPTPGANTAALIASLLDALPDFTAAASGTGATEVGPLLITQMSGGQTDTLRTLSLDGGPPVSLTYSGTYTLMSAGSGSGPSGAACGIGRLSSAKATSWLVVQVDLDALPTNSLSASSLVGQKEFSDTKIREAIDRAVAWVEKDYLSTPIEAAMVVTEGDTNLDDFPFAPRDGYFTTTSEYDWDFFTQPVHLTASADTAKWFTIHTPHTHILRLDALFGSMAVYRVLNIDAAWIEEGYVGGMVRLLPYARSLIYDYIGLFRMSLMRGDGTIPNFWHYAAVVGLREASPDILELVGKKAALEVLIMLGQAFRPGLGSISMSRDGVSQSTSLLASQAYGIYTGPIKMYLDWFEKYGNLVRARYRGARWTVV